MFDYNFVLDRLPDPGDLHRALAEVFAVDPAGVYVGRRFADGGGPPATVYCSYVDVEGGEFRWLMELSADATVTEPAELAAVQALCRRFGLRALLPVEEDLDEWWWLITPEDHRVVDLDLDELDEDRYVLAERSR